ncbi:MAG: hypothetical protein LBT88_04575 [Oscillospiraceae bacterium]|nr:hypothetical protein [Oscillospiraceae bacterium]
MTKFIPYEKLSKKAKKRLDSSRRGSWGEISPVTRTSPNPKAYDRSTQKRLTDQEVRQPFYCRYFTGIA